MRQLPRQFITCLFDRHASSDTDVSVFQYALKRLERVGTHSNAIIFCYLKQQLKYPDWIVNLWKLLIFLPTYDWYCINRNRLCFFRFFLCSEVKIHQIIIYFPRLIRVQRFGMEQCTFLCPKIQCLGVFEGALNFTCPFQSP